MFISVREDKIGLVIDMSLGKYAINRQLPVKTHKIKTTGLCDLTLMFSSDPVLYIVMLYIRAIRDSEAERASSLKHRPVVREH